MSHSDAFFLGRSTLRISGTGGEYSLSKWFAIAIEKARLPDFSGRSLFVALADWLKAHVGDKAMLRPSRSPCKGHYDMVHCDHSHR